MEDWLILGIGSLLGGIIGGALICWVRLSFFEAQLGNRVYMARLSEKGVDARQDRAARYEAAMLSVGMKMKAGAKPMDALKEVAAEYPDVAMRLLEKGLQI